MARLDAYIDLLFKEPGTELLMRTGSGALLRNGESARPVVRQPLTTAQIVGAFNEVLPAELKGAFPGERAITFRYTAPAGDVNVRLESGDEGVTAVVSRCEAEPEKPASPKQRLRHTATPPSSAKQVEDAPHAMRVPKGPADPARAMSQLLSHLVAHGASDLHLTSGCEPGLRIDGEVVTLSGFGSPDADRLREMLWSIAPEKNQAQWEEIKDTDFAHETGEARFRVNVFADRRGIGAVLRIIPNQIRSVEEMGLSREVLDLCGMSKGLVLVTGPTGSGKSTTLAAMIDYINRTRSDHIITIEDPIEFVHPNKKCLVHQREVGVHTQSFKQALRAALREDPDVVLVGELRDLETISTAIETAETGHLVFGTLHTNTAPSTVDRLIDQFPSDRQEQIRMMVSESLKGVITQVLCKKIGGGRAAAREVLLCNSAVANLIREGKTFQIPSIMQTSRGSGMQMMNDTLFELVRTKQVAPADALSKAVQRSELRAAIERAGFPIDPDSES